MKRRGKDIEVQKHTMIETLQVDFNHNFETPLLHQLITRTLGALFQ